VRNEAGVGGDCQLYLCTTAPFQTSPENPEQKINQKWFNSTTEDDIALSLLTHFKQLVLKHM